MTDIFSPEKRSQIMAKVRSKNTAGERIVFRYLRKEKVYFQKHYKRAPGTPDIAIPRKKKAVFVDSDFWHGRTYSALIKKNSLNDYWSEKIKRNIERDKMQRDKLRDRGWRLLVIWEDDIKRKRTRESTLMAVKEFLIS